MRQIGHFKSFGVVVGGAFLLLAGLMLSATAHAGNQISFSKDVKPILKNNCVECHRPGGQGYLANGLDLTTYEGIMKGTRIGPVVVP